MKHDDRASAELLEVIGKTRVFLEKERERGLKLVSMGHETWSALESAVDRAHDAGNKVAEKKKDSAAALAELSARMQGCSKCKLSETRTNLVFGDGNPNARLVFVGEAPGADEDAQGLPFVGRAGQKLTKIIEAIDLKRSEVYICNILKCRPPNNRTPTSLEIECCLPHLMKQLEAIDPKIVCALGNSAAQTLLNSKAPMNRLRGRFHTFGNAIMMPTYHPAALLRNPEYRKPVWEDVQMIQRELENL
jgi:uracil-DNA glycosylase family 4